MNRLDRSRRHTTLGAEALETRQVLNAHFPGVGVPFVYPLATPAPAVVAAPAQISGVLTGTSSYTGTFVGTDSYSVSGLSTVGTASVTGGDHFVSTLANPFRYNDTYYAGDFTMTLASGATVDITYTGSGRSSTQDGPFWETLHGDAVVTSGLFKGTEYNFDAVGVGTAAGATTLTFKLS